MPVQVLPFQAKFEGPYTVEKQLSDQNYLISTPNRRRSSQLCHINLLKPCYAHACEEDQKLDVCPVLVMDSFLSNVNISEGSLDRC